MQSAVPLSQQWHKVNQLLRLCLQCPMVSQPRFLFQPMQKVRQSLFLHYLAPIHQLQLLLLRPRRPPHQQLAPTLLKNV
jgi:hypothetical protein